MISQNNIDDNDLIDDINHQKILSQQIEQDKSHLINFIVRDGDDILKKIEKKANLVDSEKKKIIRKILKYKGKIYTKEELQSFSITDLRDIYTKLTEEKKSFIQSIVSFFS